MSAHLCGQNGSSSLTNGGGRTDVGRDFASGVKRRRSTSTLDEAVLMQEDVLLPFSPLPVHQSKSFLLICSNSGTYQSEEYKPNGETLYVPISSGDVLINIRTVDQVTCERGRFFLGDDKCKYVGSAEGNVLHFWRYNAILGKLCITQSFLFTSSDEFTKATALLQSM
eukprot:m.309807 g.309807  ORF g.309807 m.309807 type:complete len:168 (+) comp47935_c0_seq1:79-582(+)